MLLYLQRMQCYIVLNVTAKQRITVMTVGSISVRTKASIQPLPYGQTACASSYSLYFSYSSAYLVSWKSLWVLTSSCWAGLAPSEDISQHTSQIFSLNTGILSFSFCNECWLFTQTLVFWWSPQIITTQIISGDLGSHNLVENNVKISRR